MVAKADLFVEIQSHLVSMGKPSAEVSIVINADKAVEYDRVIESMNAVRRSNVTRIIFAVRPAFGLK
jgi:biopolymer transport protein ExbD